MIKNCLSSYPAEADAAIDARASKPTRCLRMYDEGIVRLSSRVSKTEVQTTTRSQSERTEWISTVKIVSVLSVHKLNTLSVAVHSNFTKSTTSLCSSLALFLSWLLSAAVSAICSARVRTRVGCVSFLFWQELYSSSIHQALTKKQPKLNFSELILGCTKKKLSN